MVAAKPTEEINALIVRLFELKGDDMVAPSVELFGQAMTQSFNLDRSEYKSEVTEQHTGITIANTPV